MESNILQIIRKTKKNLTDKEVLTCERIISYLTGKAAKVHQHFRIPSSVLTLTYDTDSDMAACTDNQNYYINAACSIVKGTRQQKLDVICGLLLHEIGHRIFTSATTMSIIKTSIMSGKLAFVPMERTPFQDQALEELEIYLSDPKKAKLFFSIYHFLWNVFEDAKIEYLLLAHCKEFIVLHDGLKLMRDRVYDGVPTYLDMAKMYEDEDKKMQTLFQALLSYALYGELKELNYDEHKLDPLLLDLEPCLPYADVCIEATNDAVFFHNLHFCILELWPFIKEQLDKLEDDEQNEDSDNSGDESSQGQSAEQALSQILENISGMLNETVGVTKSPGEEKSVQQVLSQGSGSQSSDPAGNAISLSGEESEDGNPAKPPFTRNLQISSPGIGSGAVTHETETPSSILNVAEKEITEVKVIKMQEQEMDELIREAQVKTDFSSAHKDIDCRIVRQTVTPEAKDTYNRLAPPLNAIAKKMAKRSDFFSEEENPVTFRNRYYGTRFHANTIARKDFRNFSQKVNLEEAPSLAVGVVIDESGSMGGLKCQVARKMAIMLHEYCLLMGVPVSIYGHSTDGNKVVLYPYTDFEQAFPDDKYRLANIRSRMSNRDGYALRFMYQRLMDQPEENKMLIIVSDGAPAHSGYHGSGAFADLRDVAKMCEKNDVIFLAAAIDDDKEEIMAAYGKQHFLDITDLEKLPVKMTSIIKSMLQ